MKFDYDKEFGKIRGYYRVIVKFWQNCYFILKFMLKRHDTLASDRNINPEDWNQTILTWRAAYKQAFEVWTKHYMFDSEKAKLGKAYTDHDSCHDLYYNELSQKSMRFFIDVISTMCVEDTIYRELFSMWSFEFQFMMNAKFNPDQENIHVAYCNYQRNDSQYYILNKEIKEKVRSKLGKAKRMTGKYHQMLGDERQKAYAIKRMEMERINAENKAKDMKEILKEVNKKG